MTVTTWVDVDQQALATNFRILSGLLAPGAALQAVVKADGYGHGAVPVARSFLQAGAVSLGVATGDEALELRAAGIRAPILVLTGILGRRGESLLVEQGVELTVCSRHELRWAEEAASQAGSPARVHLKVDTGLGRLGVPWDRALDLGRSIASSPYLQLRGVFSHLARADEDNPDAREYTHLQGERYGRVLESFHAAGLRPGWRHLANSAALMHYPELHFDLVRAGCSLYGFFPTSRETESSLAPLWPGLHWRALVLETWPQNGHTRVVRIGAGSGHGVPSRAGQVLLDGKRWPVRAVETWSLWAEVGRNAKVYPGSVATLVGWDGAAFLPVEEVAGWAGTIHEELGCSLARLRRRYTEPEGPDGVDSGEKSGVE